MDAYSFVFPYQVRVSDINYGGHVSNAAVLSIFQDARIAYLANLGPFSELDLGGYGIILPEAHAYYHAEMFLGDQLRVGVRGGGVRRSSFLLLYRIERDGQLMAEGETPVVCYDYETRKARRIPEDFREALCRFEGL